MSSIDKVREFHLAFGHPVAPAPTAATAELRVLRVRLIAEELTELCQALGVTLMISCTARGSVEPYVHVRAEEGVHVDLVEAADALGDLDYVVQGANLVFGFPAEQVMDEIQRSNMSKLGEDGKPIYREDGKILKGPNYFKPDIKKVLGL